MPPDTITILLLATTAALASVAGGLIALWHKPTTLLTSLALGFASGVLIGTVTLQMIPRAIEMGSLAGVIIGFVAGLGAIYAFDLFIHRGVIAGERAEQRQLVERVYRQKRPLGDEVTVLAGGTSVEEFIEGLSIGAAAAIDSGLALLIATAIVVDNVSEGLSIGELVRTESEDGAEENLRRVLIWTGFIAIALLSSTIVGWFLLRGLSQPILAFLLALGAGALLYLTVTDLVPTGQARQYQQSSALATAGGFLVMLILQAFV